MWSEGQESRIRFRVFSRLLINEFVLIHIVIEGRYYGNNNKTNVRINGIDFGEQALSRDNRKLTIPVDALLPYEGVEVILEHQEPISPAVFEGKSDDRALAFAMSNIGYTLTGSRDVVSVD